MIHTTNKVRVRYAETDRMGVVYHSNYLVWFETARIQMLDQIGLPYREIEKRGLFLPVLNISAEYKSPARFDDCLDIHLFMKTKPRARIHFEYEVCRDAELLATGNSTHGFIDTTSKCVRPPEDLTNLIELAWS